VTCGDGSCNEPPAPLPDGPIPDRDGGADATLDPDAADAHAPPATAPPTTTAATRPSTPRTPADAHGSDGAPDASGDTGADAGRDAGPDGATTVFHPLTTPGSRPSSSTTSTRASRAARGCTRAPSTAERLLPSATRGASLAVRIDTRKDFTQKDAWSAFDLNTVAAQLNGFGCGIFDGRFVYAVPFNHAGIFARFDTAKNTPITDQSAWASFDTTTIHAGIPG